MDNKDKNQFRSDSESFTAEKILLEENYEHSIEKDFVLPDYYPDIFRVLKCFVTPVITTQGINGDKLSFEGTALIRVIYVSENSAAINCVEQKVTFSKTADLTGECVNPDVTIVPDCEYVNCRVVNQRRLDIRGAVTTAVKAVGEETANAITDAYGSGIQLKKELCSLPAKRITAAKRITLIEELELSESKPPVGTVIRCSCKVSDTEEKIIAGKLVTKGEAEIKVLYACADSEGNHGAETMKFTVPFSQIIDMEGIDETFSADVEVTAAGCEIMPKGESGRNMECELTLLVNCIGIKYIQKEIVTDAYSTCWECNLTKTEKAIPTKLTDLSKECSVSCSTNCCDGTIGKIFECFGDVKNIFCELKQDKKIFAVSGNISFGILGKDENNIPFFCENQSTFEEEIPIDDSWDITGKITFSPKVKGVNCSYIISGENSVEIKYDFTISGQIRTDRSITVIKKISVDTEKPKEQTNEYALKLCRINGKEDIWEIAKKYSTSVKAILEENDLEDDKQAAEGMLLIPLMK